jgi:hypothetical protein
MNKQQTSGFNKFTPYRVSSEDDVVYEVMQELDIDRKGYVSAADLKDRWHVLAGGAPKATSAARRRVSHTTSV